MNAYERLSPEEQLHVCFAVTCDFLKDYSRLLRQVKDWYRFPDYHRNPARVRTRYTKSERQYHGKNFRHEYF